MANGKAERSEVLACSSMAGSLEIAALAGFGMRRDVEEMKYITRYRGKDGNPSLRHPDTLFVGEHHQREREENRVLG